MDAVEQFEGALAPLPPPTREEVEHYRATSHLDEMGHFGAGHGVASHRMTGIKQDEGVPEEIASIVCECGGYTFTRRNETL